MGQENNTADVESLQKSGRRSGSCLNAFLITSIVVLFASVAALAAFGVMAVKELQSKLDVPRRVSESELFEKMSGAQQPSVTFNMEKFAYLEAMKCSLKNGTMEWADVKYGVGSSIGSKFVFDSHQMSLKPQQSGVYFMYIEVKIMCTSRCNTSVVHLNVSNKLTCDVELPSHKKSVSKKCWTVSTLENEGLITQMRVPDKGFQDWKLDLKNSGLGLFLID
uniref:TNF family profile domain-containing protein n=1 Tax=Nothobranchius korthausae TaxID=1143690 RepID=A0A1A8FK27_9TELE